MHHLFQMKMETFVPEDDESMVTARMAIETQDYAPPGPNNHHKPPGWRWTAITLIDAVLLAEGVIPHESRRASIAMVLVLDILESTYSSCHKVQRNVMFSCG